MVQNDIELRVIPTKYPSGAAKQLIYLLTGMEVLVADVLTILAY